MSVQSDFNDHLGMCPSIIPRLAAVVDGDATLNAAEAHHVESCIKCQAELVRYRKLLRALHDLRANVIHPAPGVLAGILDNLGEHGERRAIHSLITGKRVAYTSGLAVATVAGVTGALLLVGRRGKPKSKAA